MNLVTGNVAISRCRLRHAGVVSLVCLLVLAAGLLAAVPALASPSPPGLSALTPSPPSLDFFSQDMHSPSTMQETYTNYSANPTTVLSASITGPDASSYSIPQGQDFCMPGQTIQVNSSCSLTVAFYALASGPGLKNATLELMDDNGINTGTTDVALSGTSITGTLSADQNSLDFGPVVINQGNSNQQRVTITNGLSASVIVNNVQITGPDASSFNVQNNNCQSTLGTNNTCQIYIQFQPNSSGTQNAQLEINNDGTTNPLFVSLTGDGLNGPVVTVSPPQAIYGNVTLGSQGSQTFTVTDSGDAPLQIQALFLVAGSPQVFPISNDSCYGRQIAAGSSCQVTVGFVPIAAGDKDASLFLISNASNPGVTTIGLNGTGVAPTPAARGTGTSPNPAPTGTGTSPNPAPTGTVTVTGTAQAGTVLTCAAVNYPSRTSFSYQWLRNGKSITGATGQKLALGDADVGAILSCRVKATAPGGTRTVTSSGTAPTLAELTVGKVSVHGFTINAKVTFSNGKLVATSLITNGQALSSITKTGRCKHGQVHLGANGSDRCVSDSFGTRTVTTRAAATYTVSLVPNASATKALNSGQTLHVRETLTLGTRGRLKPTLKTFDVTVHGKHVNEKRK
jgi:hypothetical protein